ncbi:MAG TPA: hypothetical protein VF649_01350 [Sphingomonas sp.]
MDQPNSPRSPVEPSDLVAIVRDPAWLADRYDTDQDVVHFRHVSRDAHRAATFLTDEYLPVGRIVPVPRTTALAGAGSVASLNFILHSAFCCSTLLARAVDVEGAAMGLKEPVILNDLVGWKRRGGDPRAVARALDGALTLLARPFNVGEAVVVKPSNIVNCLAPAMLAMRAEARALLLHAPLRIFLTSVAKKGMWGRLWVRELLAGQLRDGMVDLGFDGDAYFRQTDLQVAAVGWLAQQALFARLIATYGGDRVRSLDSDALMAAPTAVMKQLITLFGMTVDAEGVEKIVAGPAFNRHSKFGTTFNSRARSGEYRDAGAAHAEEIDKVALWAEAVAVQAGVPMRLGAPLLG